MLWCIKCIFIVTNLYFKAYSVYASENHLGRSILVAQ